jgi:type I restriction enzyme M protein
LNLCGFGSIKQPQSLAKKQLSSLTDALDAQVLARYSTFTQDEIKVLTVDDKWFAAIKAGTDGEVQAVAQRLAGRVRELDERYAEPLPMLEQAVNDLGATVAGHLKKMGLAWA